MFAQPFLASGKYTSFKEFAEVKSRHMISARCVGPGVMRWEYRPRSTLYFVWAQERDGFDQFGDFNFSRDRSALFPGSADERLPDQRDLLDRTLVRVVDR